MKDSILGVAVGSCAALLLATTTMFPASTVGSFTDPTPTPTKNASFSDPFSVRWDQVVANASDSVVSIRVSSNLESSLGSGVILSESGLVVTNAHVVKDAQNADGKITVLLSDNSIHEAGVLKADFRSDLAVLKMKNPPTGLKPLRMADSSQLKVGEPVLAIGTPLGLNGTVTNGVVSSINRAMTTKIERSNQDPSETTVVNAIQTNAAINQGNSGGALLNSKGELIGINSSIATLGNNSGNIGIGFAIPSNHVKNVAGFLSEGRSFPYGRLGVKVRHIATKASGEYILGAEVVEVEIGGAAERAGVKVGDVVTKLDGSPVSSDLSLVAFIRQKKVGDPVNLDLVRNGLHRDVKVELSE